MLTDRWFRCRPDSRVVQSRCEACPMRIAHRVTHPVGRFRARAWRAFVRVDLADATRFGPHGSRRVFYPIVRMHGARPHGTRAPLRASRSTRMLGGLCVRSPLRRCMTWRTRHDRRARRVRARASRVDDATPRQMYVRACCLNDKLKRSSLRAPPACAASPVWMYLVVLEGVTCFVRCFSAIPYITLAYRSHIGVYYEKIVLYLVYTILCLVNQMNHNSE